MTEDELYFKCPSCGKFRLVKYSTKVKSAYTMTDPMDMNKAINFVQEIQICNVCLDESLGVSK